MTGGSFIPVWLGIRMRRRAGQDLWPLPSPYPLSLIPYLSNRCQIPKPHRGDGRDAGLLRELWRDPSWIEPLSS